MTPAVAATPAGGDAAARASPYAAAAVQKAVVPEVQPDVAAAPDRQWNPEDEGSAFTQFARTQEHLAGGGGSGGAAAMSPSSSLRTPLPAGSSAAAGSGGAGGGAAARPWYSFLACGCGAPPAGGGGAGGGTQPRALQPDGSQALQPRRTLSKQVSLYAGPRRTISRVKSTYSDAQWFDTLSQFGSTDIGLVEDVDAMLRDMPPGLPAIQEPGPHVPDPPLEMAEKDFVFVPLPAETGFDGYWEKDVERTSPNPQPIDVMLGSSRMAMKAHETIPGIWLHDTPGQMTMTAKPKSIPLGPLSRYVETFNKDGSQTYWSMRRDIKVGRSVGQMYFTACGTLVFRVYAKGLWGDAAEYVTEEYSRLEDEGNTIISRQCCKHLASGRTAVQYLVGDWKGADPPPGAV